MNRTKLKIITNGIELWNNGGAFAIIGSTNVLSSAMVPATKENKLQTINLFIKICTVAEI